jgi:hypothetical protein
VFQIKHEAQGGVIIRNYYDQLASGEEMKCIERKDTTSKYPSLNACTNQVFWVWAPNRNY